MALMRRPTKRLPVHYLPHVTILTSAEWEQVKQVKQAQAAEEVSEEQLLKKEKAIEKKIKREQESQCVADAKNKLFCDTEAVRRFHSALQLAAVMKEREIQLDVKRNMREVEEAQLEKEELARDREEIGNQEFEKYTQKVIASAEEAKLNLIPIVKAAGEGFESHGPILGGIPTFYQPVFEKGERKRVKGAAVEVDLSGLGFTVPEELPEYKYPGLESRRIGRVTTKLVDKDHEDKRTNFPRKESELTKFMCAHWRQKTDRN